MNYVPISHIGTSNIQKEKETLFTLIFNIQYINYIRASPFLRAYGTNFKGKDTAVYTLSFTDKATIPNTTIATRATTHTP